MYNKELLKKVRRVVASHPDRHDQGQWYGSKFGGMMLAPVEKLRKYATQPMPDVAQMPDGYCGTRACVAGWAAIFAAPRGTRLDGSTGLIFPDGSVMDVDDYAEEQLGLGYLEAADLFAPYLDREAVLERLDGFIAAAG